MLDILWSDTVLGSDGFEYTLEVTHDWMVGHGLFTDSNGQPNRWRWTVYLENSERPRANYQHGIGSLEKAIDLGTTCLRSKR